MRVIMIIGSIMAGLFSSMLLIVPVDFYAPTGMALTPMTGTVAQAHGATLAGLGLINWLARNFGPRQLRAVLAGNLLMQVLSLVVVIRTIGLGAGKAVVPGVVIHVVMSLLFGIAWVRANAKVASSALASGERPNIA